MKMKKVLPIALILLIGLSALVYAYAGEVTFSFDQGWNLVYGFGDPMNQLDEKALKLNDIKAVYGFIPTAQKYIRVYPNPEEDLGSLWGKYQVDDDDFMNQGFWVYSDKDINSEYWLLEEATPLSSRPIYGGWNFVGVTPNMIGVKIEESKGNCNILRVCGFARQNWECLEGNNLGAQTYGDQNSDIGKVFIMKVSSNCNFGDASGEDIPSVPQLPDNGNSAQCTDSDGGLDYTEKGTTSWGSSVIVDSCVNNNQLDEGFCHDDGVGGSTIVDCPNSCSDGECY